MSQRWKSDPEMGLNEAAHYLQIHSDAARPPKMMYIYFTSEDNAYGIVIDRFMNGKVQEVKLDLSINHFAKVVVTKVKSDISENCNLNSLADCFQIDKYQLLVTPCGRKSFYQQFGELYQNSPERTTNWTGNLYEHSVAGANYSGRH